MQPTRDAMEWPLSQMDREVGISFGSNFHFALSALLFKGFSHPLSTVRTRTQELLTTVFFLHSSEGCLRSVKLTVWCVGVYVCVCGCVCGVCVCGCVNLICCFLISGNFL